MAQINALRSFPGTREFSGLWRCYWWLWKSFHMYTVVSSEYNYVSSNSGFVFRLYSPGLCTTAELRYLTLCIFLK